MRTTFHDIRHFFFGPRPDKLPSRGKPLANQRGRQSRPVAWPDFKSGGGRQPFLGGFDSHCLPPILRSLSAAIVSHRIKRLSRSVPAEAASHPSPSSP
ncbi:hypothetical protein FA369_01725 [Pseudomonas aeruginosa]|nr:hypothetical protein [Pseudomonas aeruginosa]